MSPELQVGMLQHLDTFIDARVLNGRGVFELADFKAGIEEMAGAEPGDIPFDVEDDSVIVARLDHHPYLERAAIGKGAHIWRFGINQPPRSREIIGR